MAKTEIMPYDPVVLHCKIWNSSDTTQTFTVMRSFFMSTYTRYKENGEWEGYTPFSRINAGHMPPEKISIPAKAVFVDGDELIASNSKGRAIFAEPGKYWVKIVTVFGEGKPIMIVVKDPPRAEKNVIELIKSQKLYLWDSKCIVLENKNLGHGDDKTLSLENAQKNFSELLQRYPKSYYAPWAKEVLGWLDAAQKGTLKLDYPNPSKNSDKKSALDDL